MKLQIAVYHQAITALSAGQLEIGWLERFNITHFDSAKSEAIIEVTSELARIFGVAGTPICQPICNLLETIGDRTFQKSTLAAEHECMAQGKTVCVFKLMPRSTT